MIFAILPAAGLSVRMRQPKLSLPLGGKTVLEQVVAALRAAALDPILVVVGPHGASLAALAQRAGARVLVLDRQTADMRTTVEHGLRCLEEHYHPRPEDHWLLVPADHPALDPKVVQALAAGLEHAAACSIAIPTYGGRRGHPALFSWKHAAQLVQHPPGQGINSYLRTHQGETLEVPVAVESILCDLDTPGDYQELLGLWRADF